MELIIGKKERKLTKFLCREMIYDYLKGSLDEDRRRAVEKYLSQDEDLREEVERLQSAINYCQELSGAQLSQDFFEEVSEKNSKLSDWLVALSWGKLPDPVKWVLEAVVIAVIVAGFSIYVPWENLFRSFPRDKAPMVVEIEPALEVAKEDSIQLEQESRESIDVAGGLVETKASQTNQAGFESSQDSSRVQKPSVAETLVSTDPVDLEDVKHGELRGSGEQHEEHGEELEEAAAPTKKRPILVGKKEALKGVLFRAFMKLDDIERHTEEFREKILSLGGEKAGEVQVGWRKPDGSYFHFSLDEENLEPLKQFMSEYGPVRFYKDPHWRVMPEGKIRMILWVEDSEYKK